MKKTDRFIGSATSFLLFYSTTASAQSRVDGVYLSTGDANGTGVCTLIIKTLDEPHKYGGDVFELESSGEGSCEWSAVGTSKNYTINGGMVTAGGAPAFVKLSFPFGPVGNRMELTALDLDGSMRLNQVFSKQDEIASD